MGKSTQHTKGIWSVSHSPAHKTKDSNPLQPVFYKNVKDSNSIGGRIIAKCLGKDISELEANAALIAEAGTVLNETGLTPRQLQKENEQLTSELQRVRTDLIEQLRVTGNYFDENKELKEQRDTIELKYNALLLDFGIMVEQRDELLKALESIVDNAPKETLDADWWEDSFKQSYHNATALIEKHGKQE